MKCCDICGDQPRDLYDLLASYQTSTIRHVCYECKGVVDRRKSDLQTVTSRILADWLQRFMENRREKFSRGRK